MTGFNHGVTGAAIALTLKQPALAIPLAFISHFIQDAIPHFGLDEKELFKKRFNIILVLDFLFALILMIILAILFPAASPDLMWAYHRLYVERINNHKPKLGITARMHHKIQWSQTLSGIYVEALWFLLVGALILSYKA
jgi:hypothetical protein